MMTKDNPLEALLDERQVANLLNVSISTIRRRRLLRQPPDWVKIGASVRYSAESVRLLIESGKHKSRVVERPTQ